jgi:hypothetical protein
VNADLVFSDCARAMHLRRAGCRQDDWLPSAAGLGERGSPSLPLKTVRTDAWDYAARRT